MSEENRIQQKIKKRSFILYSIAAFGFLLDCFAYYPGFISPDSIDQYTQALTHQYSNWHPPIMAGFWSLLIHIKKGGALMFLLQVFFYWASFILIGKPFIKYSFRIFMVVPVIYFAPFMQNFVGNIWKDIGLAISWLFAISLMINALQENRKLNKMEGFVTLVFLSYGCWIRINALPGVIPLLSMWLYFANALTIDFKFKELILKTLGMTLVVISAQILITVFILKPNKTFPEYKLFVHDLTGIFKETNTLYFPKFITEFSGFDTAYIKQKYNYSTFDNIWWNPDNKTIIPTASSEQINELQMCWIKAIIHHPLIYLKNRSLGFLNFLRITEGNGKPFEITYHYIHPNNYGFTFKANFISKNLKSLIEFQRPMPYMKPWFWLIFNFFLLYYSHKKLINEIKIMVLCLCYSSLLYLSLEFVVFQADTEWRYFYWNCVSISVSFILIYTNYFINKGFRKKQNVASFN